MDPSERAFRICVALLLALSVAGCGRDRPRWRQLAREHVPKPLAAGYVLEARPAPGGEDAVSTAPQRVERVVPDGVHAWLETELARADFTRHPRLPVWQATVSLCGAGTPPDGSAPQRLVGGDEVFRWLRREDALVATEIEPGSFLVNEGKLWLALEQGVEPPETLKLSLFAQRGSKQGGATRLEGARFSGAGLGVWPRERVTFRSQRVTKGALRFATTVESARLDETERDAPIVFRVLVDGEPIFEHEERRVEGVTWHQVPLPETRLAQFELAFEVDGPFAFTAFYAPVIGPVDPGHFGGRPWGEQRRDIVVFQADTFRADNLVAFGGTHEPPLAPQLEAFALDGLRFLDARSVSSYTLPAHATLLTGLFPRQAGVIDRGHGLVKSIPTVAGILSELGYRTGAITEAGLVSKRFGLDRGFEWFDEVAVGDDPSAAVRGTLERVQAFLDADDGRPTFLFVQTYRVHAPYEVEDETRAELGEVLGIRDTHDVWSDRRLALAAEEPEPGTEAQRRAELQEIARAMRALYLGTVRDLDRAFERFYHDLIARDFLSNGYIVLTSDHGEAFYDHEEWFHAGTVYEEQIRVPIAIRGPDIEARAVTTPASLVDLPTTFLAMAGTHAPVDWPGSSLFDLPERRPIFSFQCFERGGVSTLCAIDQGRKVIAYENLEALQSGRMMHAYDLNTDPAERHDLAGNEDWPDAILRGTLPLLEVFLAPLGTLEGAELDAEKQRELDALGYGGNR